MKYQVVNTRTGEVKATYSRKASARSIRDHLDQLYGAAIHTVRAVPV